MESVRRYLENMFGRKLTENELAVLRVAYHMGEQNIFDQITNRVNEKRWDYFISSISFNNISNWLSDNFLDLINNSFSLSLNDLSSGALFTYPDNLNNSS